MSMNTNKPEKNANSTSGQPAEQVTQADPASNNSVQTSAPNPTDEENARARGFKPRLAGMKRWQITLAVVAVIAVAAGSGFWVWHEQPSFCSAICHTSMDAYVETYSQPANSAGIDKWGNAVENTSAMLSVAHREQGENCLSCHVPTLSEQITEAALWVTGQYENPLEETSLTTLVRWRDAGNSDGFCLKSGCHVTDDGTEVLTRADLIKQTSDRAFNPHAEQHGQRECSDCHKSHRASVYYCTKCHDEVDMPEGWLTYDESRQIAGVQ